jgi:hypothetical protein
MLVPTVPAFTLHALHQHHLVVLIPDDGAVSAGVNVIVAHTFLQILSYA